MMTTLSPMSATHPFSRLSNLMQLVREDLGQRESFQHLHQASEQFEHRKCAIQWIKFVCQTHTMSSMSRDSAIQILDTYLALKLANVSSLDSSFVSHAAVISLTLAFKIHESQRSLYLSSFQDFDLAALKKFEIMMLNELGFNLTPQLIPIGFVHELLHVWQPNEVSCSLKLANMNHQKTELIHIADRLIAGFWEERCSLLYAPSTIAIAALILAFSMLHLDCSEWLAMVPNCCLPLSNHGQEDNHDNNTFLCTIGTKYHQMFDIDACLLSFERVEILRTMATTNKSLIKPKAISPPRIFSSSPTSVTATNSVMNLNELFEVEEKPVGVASTVASPSSTSLVHILSTSSSSSVSSQSITKATTTHPSVHHRLKRSATVSSLSTLCKDYDGIGTDITNETDGIHGKLKRSSTVASLSTMFTDNVVVVNDSLCSQHDQCNKKARYD